MHLMIDLETGGTSPGCAIFSIGACLFDPYADNEPTETFYREISHSSCADIGLRFELATMEWWKKQGTPPNGPTHILQAVQDLLTWMQRYKISHYWANSPSFDISILTHVFRLYRMAWPLNFWNERDVRTIKSLAWPNNEYKLDNSHNALEDAKNQAKLVQLALYTLGLSTHANRTPAEPSNNVWQLQPN